MIVQSHQNSFRYVEKNIRRSSMYRKYNSTLPYWLRDKPQKFFKHCVERLTSAGLIKNENILSEKFKCEWYLHRLSWK